MNDTTLWKIVVGARAPRPSSLSGIQGWSARTVKPNTNSTVLKISIAAVYCFQVCGPLSRARSIARSGPRGR